MLQRKFSSNSSTRAPNKRAAEPADLQQPILTKKKKQKTEGTTAQTTQTVEPSSRGTIAQAKEIGRPSSIGTFTRNAPLQPHLGPTQLSAKSPVQVPIPFEVWEHILSWTPLPFLRSVKDLSPTFRGILASNTPWRKSRRRTFSAEHPDPPPGMHEREYAELILGSGCQNESCRRTVARTWWAFRRRWCGECLSGKIVHVSLCIQAQAVCIVDSFTPGQRMRVHLASESKGPQLYSLRKIQRARHLPRCHQLQDKPISWCFLLTRRYCQDPGTV